MWRVLSREQLRRFDGACSEKYSVPNLSLMENAGRGAADWIAQRARHASRRGARPSNVVVVAGRGNNAGDGYVVARRLRLLGVPVAVCALYAEHELQGDALANYRAAQQTGVSVLLTSGMELERELSGADWIVDAVLGTGLSREVSGPELEAINAMNAAPGHKLALDIPSGLHADTGSVLGVAVKAEHTLTFAAHKLGFFTATGLEHTGRVHLFDIGVPEFVVSDVVESALLVEGSDVRSVIPKRTQQTHKVSAGRVAIVAGSRGKVGAALLVARGAARAGAGLVTLVGERELCDVLDQRVLEAMTARFDGADFPGSLARCLENADVVVVGPGLGFSEQAVRCIEHVVLEHPGKVVVDADAISHFRGAARRLSAARGPRILTPHTGELARLLGRTSADVERERWAALAEAAAATQAVVLLKGPHTLVAAPGKTPHVGRRGSQVLATGGAGDVLSGVIAALACELDPFDAAWAAAYLHARSGERWALRHGADRGVLAREIADGIPGALAELSAERGRLTD